MEIIIILIVILIVFYFFNTTNKKKEGFDFWSNINSAFGIGGGGNRQISLNCDNADMNTCNNPNYLLNCPTQCVKINQCKKWAENGECILNPGYMNMPMKEGGWEKGGCKEVCDQQNQNIAAMKAVMANSPFNSFRNLITTK